MKSPETFDDPQLGRLTADPLVGWLGKAPWLGEICDLYVQRRDDLPTAYALWAHQQRWTKDAIQFATASLIEVKNTGWLDEGQSPVTASEFNERLRLIVVAVEKDGAFELHFDDGDLFWGHTIVVEGNLKDGLREAYPAG